MLHTPMKYLTIWHIIREKDEFEWMENPQHKKEAMKYLQQENKYSLLSLAHTPRITTAYC